jgi:hypothetical protein
MKLRLAMNSLERIRLKQFIRRKKRKRSIERYKIIRMGCQYFRREKEK